MSSSSVEELVALPDVDLVLVLNTAPQHAETVRAAIAAGKHVYCEWPLTVTSAIAEELARTRRGTRACATSSACSGGSRRITAIVRDLIAEGYVGTLRSVRMHVSMNYFQALRSPALRWTVPPENFSSVVAIYAGHFLDMLFAAVGRPTSLSALMVNQFPVVTIAGTGEAIADDDARPARAVRAARRVTRCSRCISRAASATARACRSTSPATAGDLRITNASAFGDVGDDYVIEGAHGDNLPLERLAIPASYDWLPESGLPSAVLELANLYVAFARDGVDGTQEAPSFDDAVWLHHLFDRIAQSSREGERQTVE